MIRFQSGWFPVHRNAPERWLCVKAGFPILSHSPQSHGTNGWYHFQDREPGNTSARLKRIPWTFQMRSGGIYYNKPRRRRRTCWRSDRQHTRNSRSPDRVSVTDPATHNGVSGRLKRRRYKAQIPHFRQGWLRMISQERLWTSQSACFRSAGAARCPSYSNTGRADNGIPTLSRQSYDRYPVYIRRPVKNAGALHCRYQRPYNARAHPARV